MWLVYIHVSYVYTCALYIYIVSYVYTCNVIAIDRIFKFIYIHTILLMYFSPVI